MLISERKLRKIIRSILIEKKFSGLSQYGKNKEMQIYDDLFDPNNDDLRDEVFDLIDQSYAYLGGNADIKSAADLANPQKNDYTNFLGWDIDSDPEPDVLRGMKPKAGKMKLTLSATDGSEVASDYVIGDTAQRLSDGQHYAEMSGKAATSQMKRGTPAVTDEATAAALLPGKQITWFGKHPAQYSGSDPAMQAIADQFTGTSSQKEAGKAMQYGPNGEYDGWYVRNLGGTPHAKIIFGAV
jgi:hypothetical protein